MSSELRITQRVAVAMPPNKQISSAEEGRGPSLAFRAPSRESFLGWRSATQKRSRSWHHFLIANLVEILPGMVAGEAVMSRHSTKLYHMFAVNLMTATFIPIRV